MKQLLAIAFSALILTISSWAQTGSPLASEPANATAARTHHAHYRSAAHHPKRHHARRHHHHKRA